MIVSKGCGDGRRVPMIGVATQRRARRPGGRRPGHPCGDAGAAWVYFQGLLAAPRRWASAALVPYLPGRSGYSKRLRGAASLIGHAIGLVATDTTLCSDDVWVVDSTRWNLAAPGRPPSAPRWPGGRPMATAPAIRAGLGTAAAPGVHAGWPAGQLRVGGCQGGGSPGAGGPVHRRAGLVAGRPGQVLVADKNYYGYQFQRLLTRWEVRPLRPARKGEPARAGAHLFKPLRQLIESVDQTFKGQ